MSISKQMKNFTSYRQRNTKINWLKKDYRLTCEDGMFAMYNSDGYIYARSCKYPFYGRDKVSSVDGLVNETKFYIKEATKDILALVEIESGVIQDFLFCDTSLVDTALFLYVCQALKYHGYNKNKEPFMKVDGKELAMTLGYADIVLKVSHCCIMYEGNMNSQYTNHAFNILNDLGIVQVKALEMSDDA